MKLTKTGFRINKNGKVIISMEDSALKKSSFLGETIKEKGTYYFFNRNQNGTFIYLP